MLYLELLPNELIEILFFKLRKESVALSNTSDTLKELYDKFMYNINNGLYLPINYLKNAFNINEVKSELISNINNIYKFETINLDNMIPMMNFINKIKYIYSYNSWGLGWEDKMYVISQTIDNLYIFIMYYKGEYDMRVSLAEYKTWKLLWDDFISKDEERKSRILKNNNYI
jgi:hypothetical protein